MTELRQSEDRQRWSSGQLVIVLLLQALAGCDSCARDASKNGEAVPWRPEAPPIDEDFGSALGDGISGRVLSPEGLPLAGLTVAVGGNTAVTTDDGAFTFPEAPPTYDVTVAACDRSSFVVFRRLSRRNPTLMFTKACEPPEELWNYAEVSGTLSGGLPFPLPAGGRVQIYVMSKEIFSRIQLGGTVGKKGPAYGPLQLVWLGAKSVKARLIAIGGVLSPGGWENVCVGAKELVISADGRLVEDLPLVPSPIVRLSGTATFSDPTSTRSIVIDHRWPLPGHTVTLIADLPTASASPLPFSYQVPSMEGLGGQFCMLVSAGPSQTRLCGIPGGALPIEITTAPSPQFIFPAKSADVESSTAYTWTAFAGGMYRLRFEPVMNAEIPTVDVFTSTTTDSWPDLTPFGVPFPSGNELTCRLTRFAPFPSLDVAAGPFGLTRLNGEYSQADADYIQVRAVEQSGGLVPPSPP